MPEKTKQLADGTQVATFHGIALSKVEKGNIKNKSVLVCLSIKDNPHCQGNSLKSIVEQAIKNFKHTTFLVGDETHWHNIKEDSSIINNEDIARYKEQAIAMGSIYLKENLHHFVAVMNQQNPGFNSVEFNAKYHNKTAEDLLEGINETARELNIPFKIIRWRDWVANMCPQYAIKQASIEALYTSEEDLKTALDQSVKEFVKRRQVSAKRSEANRNTPIISDLESRSRAYLNEETPAIFWIAAALGINFVAYPGKKVNLFTVTHDFFISSQRTRVANLLPGNFDKPQEIANWLEIKFKREKKIPATAIEHIQAEEHLSSSGLPACSAFSPDSVAADYMKHFRIHKLNNATLRPNSKPDNIRRTRSCDVVSYSPPQQTFFSRKKSPTRQTMLEVLPELVIAASGNTNQSTKSDTTQSTRSNTTQSTRSSTPIVADIVDCIHELSALPTTNSQSNGHGRAGLIGTFIKQFGVEGTLQLADELRCAAQETLAGEGVSCKA